MAPLAILFGLLLSLLGVIFYAIAEVKSVTALIPMFVGVVLAGLGFMALKARLRMHAMHGAALVGLIGFGVPTYRLVKTLPEAEALPIMEQALMALLCLVFVVLCVKSFIDARPRRKQEGGAGKGK